MKTKFYVKFLNNWSHLDSDLEFADIIKTSVINGKLKTNDTNYLFDDVNPIKHRKFSIGANSDHRRKIVAGHLISSMRIAFIKGIYEATNIYFQDILKAAVREGIDTDRLIGENGKTFSSKEILELGDYQKILDSISFNIFRQLENERKTKNLIIKMGKKLNINISEEKINSALPFFELRHKLVHAGGKADKEFCERYPNFLAEDGNVIKLTHTLIIKARKAIIDLVTEFDQKIVEHNIVPITEQQP